MQKFIEKIVLNVDRISSAYSILYMHACIFGIKFSYMIRYIAMSSADLRALENLHLKYTLHERSLIAVISE